MVRVAEVAFLASNVKECVDFYRRIGMVDLPTSPGRLNFARVGEQLYGVCDDKIGFFDPWTDGYSKDWRFHVAFEVPDNKLDECIEFLNCDPAVFASQQVFFDFGDARFRQAVKEVLFEELVARMGWEPFRH